MQPATSLFCQYTFPAVPQNYEPKQALPFLRCFPGALLPEQQKSKYYVGKYPFVE